MKCLFIADSSADVTFVWADAAFAARLRRATGGADASPPERGLPAALELDGAVYRLFAPLVASATVLEAQLDDSYASFECVGEARCALRRFGDFVYVGVSAGAEPEPELARDIFALRRLVEFRFGLVANDSELLRKALKPRQLERRRRVWSDLEATLGALARLRAAEQGFLVEATERLASPQPADGCLELLERVVARANAAPERERDGEEVVHAFVLVRAKLLALYSARNVGLLAPSDLLLLTLVAQKMFPRAREGGGAARESAAAPTAASGENAPAGMADSRRAESSGSSDRGGQRLPGKRSNGGAAGAQGSGGGAEMGRRLGKTEFEIGSSEVTNPRSQSPSHFSQNTSSEEDFQLALDSVTDDTVLAELTEGGSRGGGSSALAATIAPFLFGFEAQRLTASPAAGQREDDDEGLPKRVFLETGGRENYSPLTPHNLYCYEVHPGITLCLLSRGPSSRLAAPMSSLLEYFTFVEKSLGEGNRPRLKDDLERKIKQIIDCQKIGRSQATSLQEAWQLFKRKLLVKSNEPLDVDCLTSACRTIQKSLCRAFNVLYLLDVPSTHMYRSLEEGALQSMRKKLDDYKDFLLVKSARNVTMAAYLEKFPGLVHFLYTDRALGLLVAPALHTEGGLELGHGAMAHVVRDLIWWFVSFSRRMLRRGYNSIAVRKGDIVCSYFLWFRDTSGKSLTAPNLEVDVEDGLGGRPVGVLAGDSYRRLMWLSARRRQEEVRCYEMVALHMAVVPAKCIAQQCQQLVKTLWEPPGLPLL